MLGSGGGGGKWFNNIRGKRLRSLKRKFIFFEHVAVSDKSGRYMVYSQTSMIAFRSSPEISADHAYYPSFIT